TVDGTEYDYRIVTLDTAGNRSTSSSYGPILSFDNIGGGDSVAPEEVTGFGSTSGDEFIYLTWTPSGNTALDLIDQHLSMSTDGGSSYGAPTSLGKLVVESLTNGQGYHFKLQVEDSSGNISAGVVIGPVTPDASAFQTVSGTISIDTTWAAGVFYVSEHLTVNAGVTLTINPGVVVKVRQSHRITMNGNLVSVGTLADPIIFTSYTDDSVGGDTNNDGPSSGTPGYWDYLNITESSNAAITRLDYTEIRYGGGSTASLHLRMSAPVMNCVFRDNLGHGVYAYGSASLFEDNQFIDNGGSGVYHENRGGNYPAVYRNNTFSGNQHGMYMRDSDDSVTIDGNTVTNNSDWGIYFYSTPSGSPISNNTITGNNRPLRVPFSMLPEAADNNTINTNTQNHIQVLGNSRTQPLVLPDNQIYWQDFGQATVATGVNMSMGPGTIWKMSLNTSFYVDGALTAVGDPSDKIIFTSYRDDSAGGDTNNDGLSSGVPGDWYYVYFRGASLDFLTRMEDVEVRYGGQATASIRTEQASPTFKNCVVRDSKNYGFYNSGFSGVVDNCEIKDNTLSGIYDENSGGVHSPDYINNTISGNQHGLYLNDPDNSVTISNNQIINNDNWGVYFNSTPTTPTLMNNTITGNLWAGFIPATGVPGSGDGNVLVPNQVNGLWVRGQSRYTDLHLEVLTGGGQELNTYQVNGSLIMQTGTTMTVDPGVTMKFESNGRLTIKGNLDAQGTASQRIGFTSHRDDRLGGDLDLNGYGGTPANGDWQGLYLADGVDGGTVLDYVAIRYGGLVDAGLYADRTDFSISNSEVSNSSRYGIRAFEASVTISNTEIFSNALTGVYLSTSGSSTITGGRIYAGLNDGVHLDGSSGLTMLGTEIFTNLGDGLRNNGNQVVVATGNWWGAVDGPGGDAPGAGDQVSNTSTGSIDSSGFLLSGSNFNFFNAGPNTGEGTLANPAVTQGADTSEFGSGSDTRVLYDLDRVILDYPNVPSSDLYDLIVTYYNPEDTSGIGGNIQSLTAGPADNFDIHGALSITSTVQNKRYALDAGAHAGSTLMLNAIRDNGYRSVVSRLWLIERAVSADVTAPVSSIENPTAAAQLNGGMVDLTGTTTEAGELDLVEVGIDDGSGVVWRPVTQLNTDNSWRYRWSLPADGNYTLSVRGADTAGNVETAGAGIAVVVNQSAPAAVTNVYSSDAIADNGGSIDVFWDLSADDGNDVATYEIERRDTGTAIFSLVTSVAAGNATATDTTTVDGTEYDYRIVTLDTR
ncbi:MAG TPA: right-handed parallel beta-helix repeat-containing protein, partial [Myxococcales bacterium]|nr:right-handed parallel beta-helix repeat-containing protein [Myxococcales bacterium]